MQNKDTAPKFHSKNPLAVFAQAPIGVSFDTQEEDEKIILLLRAHIITLFPAFVFILLFLFLPIFAPTLLLVVGIDILRFLSSGQIFWLYVVWYLFVAGFAFYKFIFWYFNVYLLTNERIIDFDFRGILDKETEYATLEHIEDVSPRVKGFFRTLFNFGDVFIQTAAERPEFKFRAVENPEEVARTIMEQVRQVETKMRGTSHNAN